MPEKDAYVQKMHAKLDEWNAEIDKLKAKADKAEAESRLEYQKEIETLQKRRKEAEEKLGEVRQAGEGAWEDLKDISMVLARYGAPGFATGAVAVLGPTRMAYGRTISAVRYVAGLMSDMVIEAFSG